MLQILDFDKSAIESAVKAAESRSTGEIMVFVEQRGRPDVPARAREVFQARGLAKTRDRNAVLLYIHLKQRELAVLADAGLYQKVDSAFWQTLCDAVRDCFRRNEMTVGVILGVMLAGEQLARFFPGDGAPRPNQLPDCAEGEK